MEKFQRITSIVTPFDKVNVDTDQIVPKQFLKLIQKSGFGKYLFYNWRFDSNNKPNPDFILNDPKYNESKILIAGNNFGCGSSREHAVWALQDYGFLVIIAPSFADIFYSNCFKNGILPISLDQETVEQLQHFTSEIQIDLENQTITGENTSIHFDIDPHKKKILLEGLDDIALTMQYEDKISEFEKNTIVPSVL